jgi:hypothetical protein
MVVYKTLKQEMKMKANAFSAIMLLTMLILTSCQKELDPQSSPPPPTGSSKIKTYTEDLTYGGQQSVETYNLNYDSQDRLTSMVSVTNPGNKFLYSYGPSNVFHMDLYDDNILSIHEDFYLNSASMTDSTFQYNNTGDSSTEKYLYNAAKQVIAIKYYEYTKSTGGVLQSTTRLEHDSKGNVTKEISDAGVTSYTFYPDLQNTVMGTNPYDTKNPNLTKTTTGDIGGITVTLNHTYTFDASNRVTSERAADTITGIVLIKSYTYY